MSFHNYGIYGSLGGGIVLVFKKMSFHNGGRKRVAIILLY